jgi:hypothetical protein
MKQRNTLLKIATVLSSVLLVGGAVSYRAGAFSRIVAAITRPADAESNRALRGSENAPTDSDSSQQPSQKAKDNTIMSSPKSW